MAILQTLVIGIVTTATLDIWQQIYRLIFGTPITDWAMIGRWAGHIPEGQFVQPDIGKAPPIANELILGWIVHYVVGIGYAVVYLLLMRFIIGSPPSFVSALVFGAVSVGVTWFFMEPILGAGIMGSKIPQQASAMAHDFTSHLSLGLGLYIGALVAGLI
ncbi:MAG: DUF2938 family protein [Methylovirgula sp.]|uniref:DUF2938 family protein n=1 Tax=Methylovirgula sp. TaxID=1978224 RepID=UPI0030764FEE